MASNDCHFVTVWDLPGTTIEEVSAILGDAAGLARWWPSVYLDVRILEPGADSGTGQLVALYTKGWLPYTLRWRFRVTESHPPHGFVIEAVGDFVGRGEWTLQQMRLDVRVTYDWRIRAEKGVLRRLSFVVKPVLGANHRWAMARGRDSMRIELARRRAGGDRTILTALPSPPGPTFPHSLAVFRRGRAA